MEFCKKHSNNYVASWQKKTEQLPWDFIKYFFLQWEDYSWMRISEPTTTYRVSFITSTFNILLYLWFVDMKINWHLFLDILSSWWDGTLFIFLIFSNFQYWTTIIFASFQTSKGNSKLVRRFGLLIFIVNFSWSRIK